MGMQGLIRISFPHVLSSCAFPQPSRAQDVSQSLFSIGSNFNEPQYH